ncbi:MAG: radical SAM protein [Spirochaetota bacterium]|nr:radical SAM protein [Spirochaetota bacterium]
MRDILINIHSIIPISRVNGPGNRMVIFFQGCYNNCIECFNPNTHSFEIRNLYTPKDILKQFIKQNIEGITISGGEPFCQPLGLKNLLKIAKENYNLSTLVYTGFNFEQLNKKKECQFCFKYIDILIDGQYDKSKLEPTLLARGSYNQKLYFFTDRYKLEDLYMPAKAEIIIEKDGTIKKTGFSCVN